MDGLRAVRAHGADPSGVLLVPFPGLSLARSSAAIPGVPWSVSAKVLAVAVVSALSCPVVGILVVFLEAPRLCMSSCRRLSRGRSKSGILFLYQVLIRY